MIIPDSYRDRLIKYIPAETVILFITVYGYLYMVSGTAPWFPVAARGILIAGITGTWLYLWRVERVTDWIQLVISTAGFVIWTAALGVVPFQDIPWYRPDRSRPAAAVYTAVTPLIGGGMPDRF